MTQKINYAMVRENLLHYTVSHNVFLYMIMQIFLQQSCRKLTNMLFSRCILTVLFGKDRS